jgi:uncharacterized protein involved in exopolysaccharide biosynthesis
MEEDVKTLGDYVEALKRRRTLFLGVMVVIAVVSAAVAFLLPPVYRAQATILIEQQEIPSDLVRSTVTTYANQRIQLISQRVLTTTNLQQLIERYDLYLEERREQPLEAVVDRMRGDIELETVNAEVVDPRSGRPTEATIAFTLAYESKDPRTAQVVANELTTLFLNENVRSRTEQAQEASTFLADEADKLQRQVAALEAELAEFKERNVNRLPELTQLNLQLLDRTERELVEVDRQIQSLEERRIMLQSQLAQLNPYDRIVSETGERLLGPADRLKVLQTEYVSLAARYSQDHPDLVKMRREIDALQAQVGGSAGVEGLAAQLEDTRAELASARERYSAEHPDVKRLEREVAGLEARLAAAPADAGRATLGRPDNPAYIQLQAQLDAARTELASQREKRARLEAKVAGFEERLVATPQVEREYKSLMRNYENAVAKFQEVKAKQLEAELAQSLEAERKGERFTLIEPPLLPEEPVKPNRIAILFLGVVFSFAGGIGSAAVREALDDTVRGARGVANLVAAPPLAAIPFIETPADRRRRLARRAGAVAFVLVLIGLAAAAFHLLVMPIDVAWFAALRRFGL